ncbi:MAG: glycosyl hydrolase-related protein, partial [Verrucomicrobiota bacterium]
MYATVSGTDTADDFGITLSSSATVVDYQDRSGLASTDTDYVPGTVLQPVLLSTRRQCGTYGGHDEYWTQEGTHDFKFSLTSHAKGYENGRKQGVQNNNALIAIVPSKPAGATGTLAESQSFCSVGSDDVIVTTIKRSEDKDDNKTYNAIIRLYRLGESGGPAKVDVSFMTDASPKLPVKSYIKTNMIEEDESNHPTPGSAITVPVGSYAIETYRLNVQ